MRSIILAGALLALAAQPVLAEPKAEPAAEAAAPARTHPKYTLETPILTLMEDPRTLAFLDKHMPGLSDRMRDPEVATIFGNSSIDDMSKDPDHGRMLTPAVMAKLAKALDEAQAEPAKPLGSP